MTDVRFKNFVDEGTTGQVWIRDTAHADGGTWGTVSGGVSDGDKGDITVSGSGATWTIDNDVVTFAKMQNLNTDRIVGRDTAGSGDPEEIAMDGVTLEFSGSQTLRVKDAGITTAKLADATNTTTGVTFPKMRHIATGQLIGNMSGSTGAPTEVPIGNPIQFSGGALTVNSGDFGDVTIAAGWGSITIDADVVTFAKMQDIATDTLIGRDTAGSGDPEAISMDGTTLEFSGSATLRVKDLGISTGKIAANAVTFAKIQNMSTDQRLIGSPVGSVIPGEVALGASLGMSGSTIQRAALTGDVTAAANSNTTAIAAGVIVTADLADATGTTDGVTFAKLRWLPTSSLVGRTTAATGVAEVLGITAPMAFSGANLTMSLAGGDVTSPSGSAVATIANNAVTNAKILNATIEASTKLADATSTTTGVTFPKMRQIATDTVLGRDTAGTGAPEALACGGSGVAIGASGIFREALTGDVTASSASNATNIANNVVGEAEITLTDVTTWNATTGRHGFLLKLSGVAANRLNGNGAWV